MCCTQLAENTGRKKVTNNRHLCTIAQLFRAISSQLRHVLTIGKNLLSSNMCNRCPRNMVNFGPLTAEICSGVWDTPANFNGFRILAALLHGSQVVSVSQTLRRWTVGITYVQQGDQPTITLGIGPHSSCDWSSGQPDCQVQTGIPPPIRQSHQTGLSYRANCALCVANLPVLQWSVWCACQEISFHCSSEFC